MLELVSYNISAKCMNTKMLFGERLIELNTNNSLSMTYICTI